LEMISRPSTLKYIYFFFNFRIIIIILECL
jgi:hypothetical protein